VFAQVVQPDSGETLPRVMDVFPTADTLPTNLLRMYILFSKPMQTIGNLEKIQLLSESGQTIEGAIFNNVQELWNQDQTRLTILFDPSRVKTGLQAHLAMGRALREGEKYQLIIGSLLDVEGYPTSTYSKAFHVSYEDNSPPNKDLWEIIVPEADSQAPLIVQFPGMLDQLSMTQRLQLTTENNQHIQGIERAMKEETEWHFQPSSNWKPGTYVLHVHASLEDPAGNNLKGKFEWPADSPKNSMKPTVEQLIINIE